MKTTINSKKLSDAVGVASKWVAHTPIIESTGGYLLDFDKDALSITATDALSGDITLFVPCECDSDDFSTVVDAKLFGSTVTMMSKVSDVVSMRSLKSSVVLECEGHSIKIRTLDPNSFPQVDYNVGNEKEIVIDQDLLLEAISYVRDAANPKDPREILSGAHFNGDDVVTIDGFRIILAKEVPFWDSPVTIPITSCIKLSSALSSVDSTIVLKSDGSTKLVFEWDGGIARVTMMSGEYPDYNTLLPKTHEAVVEIPREDLLTALTFARPFAESSNNVVSLTISNGTGMLKTESLTGKNESEMEVCEQEGDDFEILLSYVFLKDAASKLEDPISIGYGDSMRMVMLWSGEWGKENLLYGIMPMYS